MFHAAPVCVGMTRTVPRLVRCEHCATEYVYELTRTGYGEAGFGLGGDEATNYARAVEAAHAALTKSLATGAEAVPCPECKKYQRHMNAAAKHLQMGWLRGLGMQGLAVLPVVAVAAVLVAVVLFPNNSEKPVIAVVATACTLVLAAIVTAFIFRFTPCDPNSWSEAYRAAQAGALACTRDDFLLVAATGGPFVEDLIAGREAEYEGVTFLWVTTEEIAAEEVVPYVTPDGRELDVELTDADSDGVFLDEERVDDPEGRKHRICLRVFSVYAPATSAGAEQT